DVLQLVVVSTMLIHIGNRHIAGCPFGIRIALGGHARDWEHCTVLIATYFGHRYFCRCIARPFPPFRTWYLKPIPMCLTRPLEGKTLPQPFYSHQFWPFRNFPPRELL